MHDIALSSTEHSRWLIANIFGLVVVVAVAILLTVLVVVALVVPILVLARQIGNEAPKINAALTDAVHNTAPLGALRTTIEYATTIIGGLQRGRARLGG